MKNELDDAFDGFAQWLRAERPDAARIVDHLRATPLPFIACHIPELGARACFDYAFEFLHVLGQHNLALSVGFCMNQYIAFSIACLPAAPGTTIHTLKTQFLEAVAANRWVLAVSSFDDFVRHKDEAGNRVRCVTQNDGSVLCTGIKNFQSNVSRADVLLFSGLLDGNATGLFYTPLRDVPGLTLGEPVFPGAMADADTRSVKFENVKLSPQQVIPASADATTASFHALTRVIFAAMAMAPYLGGAKRALEETCAFLNNVHVGDQPLAAMDGYIVDVGRAHLDYLNCLALVDRFAGSLETLETDLAEWLERERLATAALKIEVTRVCEELVSFARKTIGTRSLMPASAVSVLSQQILFGALHPEVNAKIEREFGARALKDEPFTTLRR
jgi:alkylation response protein AidB-like acyl-CoA dehydrogenase